jgi:hypothetical protein
MKNLRRRPSPGTVFGLLALVIAVTGTAFAGPLATTSVLNKKERKQVRKIAGGQVKKLAPGLAVARERVTPRRWTAGTRATSRRRAGSIARAGSW